MIILVINDTHCGSNYGLNIESNNPFQKWVYDKFQEVVDYSQRVKIDYLVGIGDLVDGYGGKDSTSHWTTDVNKQVECANQLLKQLINPTTKIIGVGGSGYHRGKGSGFDGDRMVIESLGGTYHKNKCYLKTPFENILFTHVGKNIKNEANILRILNGEIIGHNVKLLVTGHLHRYEAYEVGSVKIMHTPCWQYPTDFMEGYGVALPIDIGCAVIRIDEFGIQTQPIKFPMPFELIQEMSGWAEITEKEIQEKEKEKWKRISELSHLSTNSVKKVLTIERESLNLPNIPSSPNFKQIKPERQDIPSSIFEEINNKMKK